VKAEKEWVLNFSQSQKSKESTLFGPLSVD